MILSATALVHEIGLNAIKYFCAMASAMASLVGISVVHRELLGGQRCMVERFFFVPSFLGRGLLLHERKPT